MVSMAVDRVDSDEIDAACCGIHLCLQCLSGTQKQ